MIPREIPKVPSLPANPDQSLGPFEAELHRAVLILHQSALARDSWFNSLRNYRVVSTPNRRMHTSLGRASGLFGLPSIPWQFNVSADGNTWWPSPSRAIAATDAAGGGRGRLGEPYQPTASGQDFDTLSAENPLPLAVGARSFYLKFTLSADSVYCSDDTFQPGIPIADVEAVNVALGDVPAELPTSIFVPWADVPPAAPPAARIPTHHFALWFRFSHYWHPVAETAFSSSSSSSLSSQQSSHSSVDSSGSASKSPPGKPIVL